VNLAVAPALQHNHPDSTRMTIKLPALKLRITPPAESAVRDGHPWIFSNSITKQNRDGVSGEYAVVYDRNNEFLCIGLYDPFSPLRVRVLHAGKPITLDGAWWRARFERALRLRTDLATPQTTGFRYCNGESDGWPGFVLDRYDTTLVIKLYSTAWFSHLNRLLELIVDRLAPESIVLRLSRNIQQTAEEAGLADGQVSFGPPIQKPVTFFENGLLFHADVIRGQKTGFFLDQRENRKKVQGLAEHRDVLNVFSFAGGFSLYAAAGGARSATDLDISRHALEQAKQNFGLNQSDSNVARCEHYVIQADAFEWLENPSPASYDLIVLDPPSMAKKEIERTEAIRAYGHLVKQALLRLRKQGILVAASCSAHVSAEEFFEAIQAAIRRSRRTFEVLKTTRHPQDHPAAFREASYLKCLYARISD